MQSISVSLSDSAINRAASNTDISELRDQRSPLVFRFHKSREKGTWYLVQYQKRQKIRHRMGYWPLLKTKDAQAMLPDVVKQLGRGELVAADKFDTVSQLLEWYRERCIAETVKADTRKKTIISHISKHLIPKLGKLRLCELNKQVVDELLFLPLQAEGLKPSTIKHMFYTLKPAFKRAVNLGYISNNPMAGILFGQHITKRIKPKEAALLVPDKAALILALMAQPMARRMFLLFMLLFGTRIGETRQLKWQHILLDERRIVIPASITKTEESHILPITDVAYELLQKYQAAGYAKQVYVFEVNRQPVNSSQAQRMVRQVSAGKWCAHDLRKFARTSWAELGIDYWVGERLLNHKPKGLDAVYIRAGALDVKLQALDKYHNWLFEG